MLGDDVLMLLVVVDETSRQVEVLLFVQQVM